jgi:hypothetical protein
VTDERFVSPAERVTPYQAELLTILMEECSEATQRASKAIRFGLDEIQPGQPLSNSERLAAELGDVLAMVDKLVDARVVKCADVERTRLTKHAKLAKYMQTEAP